MSAAGAAELATAYLSIIPSLRGARESITSQVSPAAAAAGEEGGASLGGMLLGGIKKFAAPIAVLAAGFGIHKVIEDSTEAFEGLGNTAMKLQAVTGGSVSQVTSLTGAMSFFGMNADASSQTLGIFSKNLGNANKDGKTSSAMIQKLGFDFRDAHGQVLPMSDLMPKLADKFQTMPDGAEKTALAMQLFGRSGAQMLPFLNQGAAGLAGLEDKAKSSGLVLDDVSMRIFMQGKLSAAAWTGSIQGAKVALGQDLAPVLEAFHNTGHNLVIPMLNTFAAVMNAGRDKALTFADGIEKFGERGGEAVKGLIDLVTKGDFTEGLGKALGIEEDSPIVGAILTIRTKVVDGVTDISKALKDAKAGFMLPNMDTSKMTPALAAAVTFGKGLRDTFTAAKDAVGPIMSSLAQAAAPVMAVFKTLAPTLGPLIPQLFALAGALSPVQLVFKALLPVLPALLGALGQLAGSALKAVLSIVTALLPVATQLSGVLIKLLSGAIIQLMPTVIQVVGMLSKIFAQLGPIIGQVLAALMPLVTMILGVVVQAFTLLLPPIMSIVTMALPLLTQILGVVVAAIVPVVQILADVLIPVIRALLPVVQTVFTIIAAVITSVMQIVQGIIQVVLGIITGNWSEVWTGLGNILAGIWNTIVAVVSGALNFLSGYIGAVLGIIGGIWNGVWSGISGFFGGIWSGLIGAAQGGLGQIIGFFEGLGGQVIGALAGAGGWLIGVGRDIINGLLSGIGSMVGAIGNAILSLIPGPIVGVFKAALGIASPSKVFHGFGQNTVQGYIDGVTGMHDDVRAAVAGTAAAATGAFNPSLAAAGTNAGGLAGAGGGVTLKQENTFTGMSEETAADLAARRMLRMAKSL